MDRQIPPPADREEDRLAVGMETIVAEVFDNQITVRQGYREVQKPDLQAFKVLGKHAVFVRAAREALRRRGQKAE